MGRSATKRAKKAAAKAASGAARSAPLRAVDLGHAFVRGGDIKTFVAATDARERARSSDGNDAEDDVVDRIDAATLAASYEDAARTVEVRRGFDFRALAVDASAASWSLFGDASRAVAAETTTEDATVRASASAMVNVGGDASAVRKTRAPAPPLARAPAPTARKKRAPRAIRAPVSGVEVLGVGDASGIDVMARAWRAPEEKDMLEKWHASVDDWRDDYKRKRRAALRHKKGVGSTIMA